MVTIASIPMWIANREGKNDKPVNEGSLQLTELLRFPKADWLGNGFALDGGKITHPGILSHRW
jgi:hypothetical protein